MRLLRILGITLFFTASVQAQWKNIGPQGGLVDAVATDHQHSGVLYCGTNTGEIYKTIDDGQSWTFLTKLQGFVRKIAVDSVSGNRIVIATSDEIVYSINGGATFAGSATDELTDVFDIVISPLNAVQMMAVNPEAIYRSNNSGQSWSPVVEADDTTQITVFNFNPQDPQNTFYWATITDNGLSRIFFTTNGGSNVSTVRVLPQDWQTRKLYVSGDVTSTVMAMIGSEDSTKIIRSTNNGGSWTTVYASSIPLVDASPLPYAFSWLPRPGNDAEQVVAWSGGFLKTNNRGVTWTPMGNPPKSFTALVRSAVDTSKFYGRVIGENGLSKVILTTFGSLGLTDINAGLTATAIRRLLYVDGEEIIAQSEFNELLLSQNGGFDFRKFAIVGGGEVVAAYESEFDGAYYWLYEDGDLYRSPSGISAFLDDSIPFTLGLNKVIDAKFVKYYDPVADEDSSAMFVVIGKDSVTQRDLLMSVDDGQNWKSLNYGNIFGINPNLAGIHVEENPALTVLAATQQGVWKLDARFGSSWSQVFTAPVSTKIKRVASRLPNVLVQTDGGKLFAGFFEFFGGQWQFSDVTSSLSTIGPGPYEIARIFAGEDGYYLLVDQPGARRIFKTNFDVKRWVDITESPLDVLNIKNVRDDFNFDNQEAILYAGANNGIWKLNQSAILSHDTVATSTPASVNLGSSAPLIVNYRNDGTLFLQIDSFRVSGTGASAFQLADSGLSDPAKYQPFGIDIKAITPVILKFTPTGLTSPQATLNAFYRGKSSRGADSLFTLTTRLVGSAKASQISTGLKGDTLSFTGALLGSSDVGTFTLRNTGTDSMHVYGLGIKRGTYFGLTTTDEEGSSLSTFVLAPNQSQLLSFTFLPDSNGFFSDSLIIFSSAHNFASNQPDSQHVVYLTGIGTGVSVDVASLSPLLNQDLKLSANLAGLQANEVSGTLFYRQTGEFTYKEKTLTQDATGTFGSVKLSAILPAEDVTEKGIQFVIEVKSTDGISAFFPSTFSETNEPYGLGVTIRSPGLSSTGSVSLPGGTSAKAYQMISFPLRLDNRTVSNAFAASNLGTIGDRGDWQLYRYDSGTSSFVRATDNNVSFGEIQHGKSYLLITRTAKTLNSGDGRSVTQGEAFTTIEPGWNMIANPFAFSVPWAVVNYFNSGLQFTNLVVLKNGRFRYVDDLDLTSFKLEPWKGYMYYSEPDSGTFTIVYPAISSSSAGFEKSSRRSLQTDRIDPNEFIVGLGLEENGMQSTHYLGQLRDASDRNDWYDRRVLPTFDKEEVVLTFVNASSALHSDFRAISDEGHFWDVSVSVASGKAHAVLHIPVVDLPSGFKLCVLDRASTQTYGPGEAIPLSVSTSQPHRLRVVVGTNRYVTQIEDETVPTRFSLDQNFPNPFNPSTTIRYALPQTSHVRLSVYNMLGQHVATLVDATQSAAFYSVQWNGQGPGGYVASSGVYIYRLEAEALDRRTKVVQTRKMILLK